MNTSLFCFLFSLLLVFNDAQQKRVQKRIAEMRRPRIEDHPHYVRVYKLGSRVCGGSLIATDKVLTMEHCVDFVGEYRITSVPGLADLSQINDTKRYETKKIHFDKSLAVIVLKEHVTPNCKIKVIKLSPKPPTLNSIMRYVGYLIYRCKDSKYACESLQISEYELKEIYDEDFYYDHKKSSMECIGDYGGALTIKGVQYGIHLSGDCDSYGMGINVADKEIRGFLSKYATYEKDV